MTFDLYHFTPKARQTQILNTTIHHILAAPHTPTKTSTGQLTNRWTFYLICTPTKTISLECRADKNTPGSVLSNGWKATVEIRELEEWGVTNLETDAMGQVAVELDVRMGLTVADVVTVMVVNGGHRYEFEEGGADGRFWVHSQMEVLLRAGVLVDRVQVVEAQRMLRILWPEGFELPVVKGVYY
ncbi:hypothetical protein BDV25DRAFT_139134 [Aspergillus avenaceus]|uniref:DUF7770 domain-containing protein n=1 Tax=Aspergillus avenaceus TaxID=36643 RepID=A0A5N6TYL2_ASPAV|nr:hypothetical protein BDV25DRAFT_139134 [Aspergillus avenaceus]